MSGERDGDATDQPDEEAAARLRELRARYLDLWERTLSDWAEAPPSAARSR